MLDESLEPLHCVRHRSPSTLVTSNEKTTLALCFGEHLFQYVRRFTSGSTQNPLYWRMDHEYHCRIRVRTSRSWSCSCTRSSSKRINSCFFFARYRKRFPYDPYHRVGMKLERATVPTKVGSLHVEKLDIKSLRWDRKLFVEDPRETRADRLVFVTTNGTDADELGIRARFLRTSE